MLYRHPCCFVPSILIQFLCRAGLCVVMYSWFHSRTRLVRSSTTLLVPSTTGAAMQRWWCMTSLTWILLSRYACVWYMCVECAQVYIIVCLYVVASYKSPHRKWRLFYFEETTIARVMLWKNLIDALSNIDMFSKCTVWPGLPLFTLFIVHFCLPLSSISFPWFSLFPPPFPFPTNHRLKIGSKS